MWLWILLALLAGILFLPIGIVASYNVQGGKVSLKIGPISFLLYPRKKKSKSKTSKKNASSGTPRSQNTTGATLTVFLPILKNILELLGKLRRKITVKRLFIKVVLAGDDPCDLSVRYGSAWAVVGNLLPQIDNAFRVKNQNIEVLCDYQATHTLVDGVLDFSILLVELLCLVFRYGVRILKEYISIKNQRKGGIEHESKTSSNA